MKIVIITGSSRGIGAATAIACAKRGMGVIVTYHNSPQAAEQVVQMIEQQGGKAVALKLNVADSSSFEVLKDTALSALKRQWQRVSFDYLVNNAGYGLFSFCEC